MKNPFKRDKEKKKPCGLCDDTHRVRFWDKETQNFISIPCPACRKRNYF